MAIVIDLKLGGESKVSGGLNRVSTNLDKLGTKVDLLTAKLASIGAVKVNATVSGLNQIAASANNAAAATARIKPPPVMKQGPFAALSAAERAYAAKVASGSATKDDLFALRSAQRRAASATSAINGPNPNDPMAALIASARVAIGPNGKLQLMPLMRHLQAAGPGGMAGMLNLSGGAAPGGEAAGASGAASIAAPLAIAGAAVVAFAAVVKHSMSTITEYAGAYFVGGGTIGQTARLGRAGAALGMSVGESANRARSVGQNISNNGYAMAYAASLGIDTRGGIYGNLNDTDKYLKVLRDLSDPKKHSLDESRRISRALGMDDEISKLRFASPEMRKRVLDTQSREMSPAEMTKAVDAQLATNLALKEFSDVMTRLGAQVLPGVTGAANTLATIAGGIGKAMDSIPDWVKDLVGGVAPAIGFAMDPNRGQNGGRQDAVSGNTKAIQNNTRAIEAASKTIYGGGKRFRDAIPQSYTGGFFHNNNMDSLARSFGAL